jgi:hypothetical protein
MSAMNSPAGNGLKIDGKRVIGKRKAGWSLPTGTSARTTFVQSSVTTAELAKRVKALIEDLTEHGLIGA